MKRLHEYSQHFLHSHRLVAELVGHSNIRAGDVVYDLGAGSGVITSVLVARCKHVVAVEIEPHALDRLRKNMEPYHTVTIVESDILSLPEPTGSYKIFANIPFHISAAVVRKFTATRNPPKSMYLVAQKQFARKLVLGDDHFTSQLSAQIGPWFTARIRRPLRKIDFTPPPAVDTVLLEIKIRPDALLDQAQAASYREFIEQCFARQKFFTSLPRSQAGINPELRPSQLSLENWLRLYAASA